MRLKLFVILPFLGVSSALAISQSDITNPSISLRCQKLIDARAKKITHKQKIQTLIKRNKKLQFNVPAERDSLRDKLKINFKRLNHELELTSYQIKRQERVIIRQGCPGIQL